MTHNVTVYILFQRQKWKKIIVVNSRQVLNTKKHDIVCCSELLHLQCISTRKMFTTTWGWPKYPSGYTRLCWAFSMLMTVQLTQWLTLLLLTNSVWVRSLALARDSDGMWSQDREGVAGGGGLRIHGPPPPTCTVRPQKRSYQRLWERHLINCYTV